MISSLKFDLKHALLLGTSIAAFAAISTPLLAQNSENETVIVTGTRVQGMTAADSAAPITVLGSDALTHTGSADVRAALGQTVPSFTAQQFGSDTANLTLSATLRGLSPNDTLVLVNGKRRHNTGNLHVLSGGTFGGAASPDISLIPSASIDHVEVLLDGAAAQYGTDAIAGVVNFILKKKSSGGTVTVQGGRNYDRGGETFDVSMNMGMPLFDKGFVNLTVDKQFHNFTQQGGADARVVDGTQPGDPLLTGPVGGVPNSVIRRMTGYPRINPINGDAQFNLTQASVNAGYDFSDDVQLYGFGTVAHRIGKAYENVRMPGQVKATPGSAQPCSATNTNGYSTVVDATGAAACAPGVTGWTGGAGTATPIPGSVGLTGLNSRGIIVASGNPGNYTDPNELLFAPLGFRPQESIREDDYQYNVGLKFKVLDWDVDTNVGYGKDIDNIYTLNSANRSLFIDTHTSPTNFYDGSFTASQLTGTIDATHSFNVGMAGPLNVAVGAEAREDYYAIAQGDAASTYKEGAQSYPGFQATDAGAHSRKNYAVYVDLALAPIEALQLDIAGRAEHYTDFGDTQIGKITARYDFSPEFAVRGTMSTGFRAPTLGEEFYSATNVSPTSATVQLPANSAAAKVLGLPNLKPEISTNYSVGIVAHPFQDLAVTVDAYSIALGSRITGSSTVNSAGGAINTLLVNDAIAAHGNVLDPTATQNGVSAFLNGLSTLTQGVDLTVSYPTDFGDMGLIDWTLAGNYNTTALSRIAPPPAILLQSNSGATFFSPGTLFNFVHSAPQEKVGLTANWSLDAWGITFRETYYGPQKNFTSENGGVVLSDFTADNQAGVGITDLEVRYNLTEQLGLAIGGNNLFSIRQSTVPTASDGFPADGGLVLHDPVGAAFSPNGGYYYGRVTFNF
ncbi:MAG: TonB-dependent receptor [Pseudomonadota bacterium]